MEQVRNRRQIIDRRAVGIRIASLADKQEADLRNAVFAELRDAMEEGRAAIEQRFVDGEAGEPCPVRRTESRRIVESDVLAEFTTRVDETSSRALGWDTPSERSSGGDYITNEAFGHTGYTGTSIWMDPDLDLWVILLTNRVHPTRENQKHVPLRRAVADAAEMVFSCTCG